MQVFGYEIDVKKKDEKDSVKTFSSEKNHGDGAETLIAHGSSAQHQVFSYDPSVGDPGVERINISDTIIKYRRAARQSEVENAINDIVDLAITSSEENPEAVKLRMDSTDLSPEVKKKISEEFKTILKKLDFNRLGSEIFRQWYIDGRIYYHIIVGEKPGEGIVDLRKIDPRFIRKYREVHADIDPKTGAKTYTDGDEYFIYAENGFDATSGSSFHEQRGVKISKDAIAYASSGVVNESGKIVLSHIHKSLKVINQLSQLEDALVIYRIARAPERRIFYIDTGSLPKGKSDEYVSNIMSKYRNKITYNASSGEVSENTHSMSMMEDFWLPRREGGKGTEISTLPPGQNLGEIEDIVYFQRKLYKSLNVPIGRLEAENAYSMGRSSEITREEIKFQKFILTLRKHFSSLFRDMLKIQLVEKKIINSEEWDDISAKIVFDYQEENHYSELKNSEVMQERLGLLSASDDLIGKYFSHDWARKNILQQNEDEIQEEDKKIAAEKEDPRYAEIADEGDF